MQHEAVNLTGTANAGFTADQTFVLTLGGNYAVAVVGTNFGSVELQQLGPDGATYVSLYQPFDKPNGTGGTEEDLIVGKFIANGQKIFELPPGSYRFHVTSATAWASVARCPTD